MLPTGLVLLALGAAAAIGCFFWKRSSEKTAGWWSAVADIDIATALDAGDGIAVAVTGTTVAPATQDGTPQRDPVLQQESAWWRETVTEHRKGGGFVEHRHDDGAADLAHHVSVVRRHA